MQQLKVVVVPPGVPQVWLYLDGPCEPLPGFGDLTLAPEQPAKYTPHDISQLIVINLIKRKKMLTSKSNFKKSMSLTLTRPGFFGCSVAWGGGLIQPPPPPPEISAVDCAIAMDNWHTRYQTKTKKKKKKKKKKKNYANLGA